MAQKAPLFMDFVGIIQIWQTKFDHVKFHGDMVVSVSFDFFFRMEKNPSPNPFTHGPPW